MKKLYCSIFIFCLSLTFSFAQITSAWKNYFSDPLIRIEFKEIDYQEPNTDVNKKLIIFRLINTSDKKVAVNWSQKLQYGSVCYNCTGKVPEMNFVISIDPHSSVEGDPASHETNGLVILSQFNSPDVIKSQTTPLSSYELRNIEVLKLN